MNHETLNILKYVRPGGGFVPKFPVFGKVEVNGLNEEPLFTYLKVLLHVLFTYSKYWDDSFCKYFIRSALKNLPHTILISFLVCQQESLPFVNPVIGDIKKFYWSPIKVNDIRWNFEKFLIDADGMPFRR